MTTTTQEHNLRTETLKIKLNHLLPFFTEGYGRDDHGTYITDVVKVNLDNGDCRTVALLDRTGCFRSMADVVRDCLA